MAVKANIVGPDVEWRNAATDRLLATLKNYNSKDHMLEIYDDDTFDIECTLADMDDTYDQKTYKSFFPPTIHDTDSGYGRIAKVVARKYINGKKESEWSKSNMKSMSQFLKTPQKRNIERKWKAF